MSLEQAHALDPQPYLLLVMSDFEMLSPESVKTFFYVIFFFFPSFLFYMCREENLQLKPGEDQGTCFLTC